MTIFKAERQKTVFIVCQWQSTHPRCEYLGFWNQEEKWSLQEDGGWREMKLRFPVGGESLGGCCCSEKLGGWDARPAKYFVIKKFSDFSCRAVVRVLLAYVTQPGKGIFRHQGKVGGVEKCKCCCFVLRVGGIRAIISELFLVLVQSGNFSYYKCWRMWLFQVQKLLCVSFQIWSWKIKAAQLLNLLTNK